MFESAARHESFTRAAEELHVTQGAVSRQIKHLEDDLGQQLFHRDGPKVQLTDAGVQFLSATEEALGILRRSTSSLRAKSASPALTISVLPSFAAKWLVSRIPGFHSICPTTEVRMAASYEPVDFNLSPDIDLAIRFGEGGWSDLYCECLFQERLFPVCSPQFQHEMADRIRMDKLDSLPLLYASGKYDQWSDWLEAANVPAHTQKRGPRFSDFSALLQAAIEGQGIALARNLLAEDDLRAGRLVKLFDVSVLSRFNYYFVCPGGREDDGKIRPFLEWLRSEASKTDAACDRSLRHNSEGVVGNGALSSGAAF